MKLFLLIICVTAAFGADWSSVERIASGQKIEVSMQDETRARGSFLSATSDAILLRDNSGERSVSRTQIRKVRVYDPGRRLRRGLMWTAIGAGGGAAAGAAVCPSCPNEGHGYKYVGPGIAIGAGIGALGFLTSPYRTVYKDK